MVQQSVKPSPVRPISAGQHLLLLFLLFRCLDWLKFLGSWQTQFSHFPPTLEQPSGRVLLPRLLPAYLVRLNSSPRLCRLPLLYCLLLRFLKTRDITGRRLLGKSLYVLWESL